MPAEASRHIPRAGLIGAGWIGQRHAALLAGRADVRLAAVCDTEPGRAAGLAAGCRAEAFTDWRDMLDTAELDLIWVCTPPAAHAGPALAALDRGLALYLEKPIARSGDDARAIAAAARKNRSVCAVGYQWHAAEALESARRLLAGQQVGCLVGQSIGSTQPRPWFLDRAAGGGNLLERGSHHIDLARALAGEIVAVQAAASAVRLAPRAGAGDIDDAVTLLLHFAGGGLGTVVVAWTGDALPGSYWVEVTTAQTALRLDLDPRFVLSGVSHGRPVSAAERTPPFERSVGRFLAAARRGEPGHVFCGPDDAARTLAVACAAEQALASGATVHV